MNAMTRVAHNKIEYTEEIRDKIIDLIIQGNSLLSIGKMKDMPSHPTLLRWMHMYEDLAEAIPRARMEGTHVLAEQCLQIADDDTLDPADRRVKIDTRMRLIGKWNSRVYGDRVQNDTDITLRRIERVETVLVPAPVREMKDVTPKEGDE
jgi:hypothetical protein